MSIIRTEQQIRIQMTLHALLRDNPKLFHIVFHERLRDHSNNDIKAMAFRDNGRIVLAIAETQTTDDLDQWERELFRATGLIIQLSQELEHEFKSPNFYKSLRSMYHHTGTIRLPKIDEVDDRY